MSWLSFVLLGLALAMDCFAVSICLGLREKCLTPRLALAVPLIFGFFQGFMPLVGWAMGLTIQPLIENFDHWVAFILLLAVGGHMLREAFLQYRNRNDGACSSGIAISCAPIAVLTLAVATSLDALAVGLSFAFAKISLWIPALIIASTTFTVSLAGIFVGHHLGRIMRCSYLPLALGGGVLIGIGFKILIEHGVW